MFFRGGGSREVGVKLSVSQEATSDCYYKYEARMRMPWWYFLLPVFYEEGACRGSVTEELPLLVLQVVMMNTASLKSKRKLLCSWKKRKSKKKYSHRKIQIRRDLGKLFSKWTDEEIIVMYFLVTQ